MAPDRKLDRHHGQRGQHIRIAADLWERFTAVAGARERSPVLAELVAWYLGEGPRPARPESTGKADKPGQGHGG